MTKIILSQTDDFVRFAEVVTQTCNDIAVRTYVRYSSKSDKLSIDQYEKNIYFMVDNDIDVAFRTLNNVFVYGLGDTVTRDCAKGAIMNVLSQIDNNQFDDFLEITDFIKQHIDLSSVFDDVLHMNTYDSDIYVYEGDNELYTDNSNWSSIEVS